MEPLSNSIHHNVRTHFQQPSADPSWHRRNDNPNCKTSHYELWRLREYVDREIASNFEELERQGEILEATRQAPTIPKTSRRPAGLRANHGNPKYLEYTMALSLRHRRDLSSGF